MLLGHRVGRIRATAWGEAGRVVTGESLRLTLTYAEQFRFGKVSVHNSPPDVVDDGPHQFANRLDQRLYTADPRPEVDTTSGAPRSTTWRCAVGATGCAPGCIRYR